MGSPSPQQPTLSTLFRTGLVICSPWETSASWKENEFRMSNVTQTQQRMWSRDSTLPSFLKVTPLRLWLSKYLHSLRPGTKGPSFPTTYSKIIGFESYSFTDFPLPLQEHSVLSALITAISQHITSSSHKESKKGWTHLKILEIPSTLLTSPSRLRKLSRPLRSSLGSMGPEPMIEVSKRTKQTHRINGWQGESQYAF